MGNLSVFSIVAVLLPPSRMDCLLVGIIQLAHTPFCLLTISAAPIPNWLDFGYL